MGEEHRTHPSHAPSVPAPTAEEREGPPTPPPSRGKWSSPLPPKSSSGEHEAVVAFRRKADSIDETTMPLLNRLNAELEKIIEDAPPPSSENKP